MQCITALWQHKVVYKVADRKRINELLLERKTFWKENDCLDRCHIFDEKYIKPMLEALGDDEEIKAFLTGCNKEDLFYMSEFFESIYGKFTNDEMWDFLTEMENKACIN